MDATYNLNGGFKPTIKRFADLEGPDFFPTPAWATYALIDNEKFDGDIWECACGNGAMSNVLEHTGQSIFSSDLFDRGFGESGVDFLLASRRFPNVVTNPPYNAAEGFVRAGLECSSRKFALLLRLAFLEGANRANTIFAKAPPSRVWVFSERITFYPLNAVQAGTGTTAYAWFVWDKDAVTGTTELKWLRPGYKSQHRSDDPASTGASESTTAGNRHSKTPRPTREKAVVNKVALGVPMADDVTHLLLPDLFSTPRR